MTAPHVVPARILHLLLWLMLMAGTMPWARAQFTWSSGNIPQATYAAGQSLLVTGTGDHDYNAIVITNNGTINWSSGRLRSGNGGGVVNNGQWNDSAGSSYENPFGGTYVFTNGATGTYTKSGTGTTTLSNVPFNNQGLLDIQAGSVALSGGGSFSGSGRVTVSSGASLVFASNYTIPDASKLAGTGDYLLQGATLTLDGTYNASGLQLQGGTLAGSPTIAGTASWTGTLLSTSGTLTVGLGGTLTIAGSNDHDFNTRALVNEGTVNWTDGRLRSGNNGSITNRGVWNDSASSVYNNDFGGTVLTFTNAAGGTYNKTATGTTRFDVPFSNAGGVSVTAGILQLQGGGSATGNFTTGPSGAVLFSNSYSIASGATLLGTGSYQVTGGTFTVDGTVSLSSFAFSGGTLAGTHSFTGNLIWDGGSLSSGGTTTIAPTAVLTVSGNFDHDFNTRTLVNNGTVNWTAGAGRLRSGNGGLITNNGTFNDAAANVFNNDFGGTVLTFANGTSGIYNKTATGVTRFDVPFNNDGHVKVSAGTLQFQGGGTNSASGIIDAAAGASVIFSNSYTLADAASLTGAGAFAVTGGLLSANGSINVSSFSISGGRLAGTQAFVGPVTWDGGDLNSGGTTTINSGSTFTIAGGFDHDFSTRSFVNNGTFVWAAGAGRLRAGNGSTFLNAGTFNDAASTVMNNDYGGTALLFTNAPTGNYNKTATGTTRYDIPFDNNGTVTVSAGTFQLQGGGTNSATGRFNAADGALVLFSNSYTIADGSALQGAGNYQATGGTLSLNGNVNVGNFQFSGGTLAGTHVFGGNLTWNGGNLNSGGTTTIGSGATLTFAGNFDHDFSSRQIVNSGTIEWTAGRLRSGNSGAMTNNGVFKDSASNAVNNDYGGTVLVFTNSNSGTYNKLAAGTTRFDVPFDNNGAVNVNAGTLQLNGGGTNSATGTITATGGTNVVFSNNYTLAEASSLAGNGQFTLTGGTLTATGNVNVSNFSIAGGTLAGTQTFKGGVAWTGGNLNSGGTTTIANGTSFTIGPNANGDPFDHDFTTRTLVNSGTTTWAANAGRLRSGSGGAIVNNGLFIDAADSQLNNDYGGTALTFTNASGATYRKTGTGTTSILVPFLNSGTLDVQSGILGLYSSTTLFNGTTMTGDGLLQLVAGSLDADGVMSFSHFQIVGGNVGGAQTFNGSTTWTSGTFNSNGSTTVGGTFEINGSADHDFSAHAFVNSGTANWVAGAGRLRSGNGGTFTNYGTFNDSASNAWNNDLGGAVAQFNNAPSGVYNKSATGTTTFRIPMANAGTVNTQAGTLALEAGGSSTTTSRFDVAASSTLSFTGGSFAVDDGASFTGAGTVQVAGAGVTVGGNVSSSDFRIVGGTLGGSHSLLGISSWLGGNFNAAGTTTIGPSGTFSIGNTIDHDFSGHAFVNNGQVEWSGGRLRGGNGATITNNAVFNDTSGSSINNDYGGTMLVFTNSSGATYNKSGGNTTSVLVPFNTSGTVDVASGSVLGLYAGGTINSGASFTGSGQARLNGGTFTTSGSVTSASLMLTGATIAGTHSLGGAFEWDSGSFNAAGTTTIANGATFTVATASDHDFSSHGFVNNGTFAWAAGAGRLRAGNGATLTNNGLFLDGSDSDINNDYGGTTLVFTNNAGGVYRKTANTVTDFLVPLVNRGQFDVQAGSLVLHAGGTFDSGASFIGAGVTQLVGGTFTGNGTLTASNLVLAGGAIAGTPSLSGLLTWNNGGLASGGSLTIANNGLFTIATGSDHDLPGHALVNQGTVQWTGGRLRGGNGATINNSGTFIDTASSVMNNDYGGTAIAFTNAPGGIYHKAATGTTTVAIPFTNNGTLSVAAGSLVFTSSFSNSGSVMLANDATAKFPVTLSLGTSSLSGSGTVDAPAVTTGGVVAPGTPTGTLGITGNLTLQGTSLLLIELGGTTQGTGYDFVSVGGGTTLGGNLGLSLINGFGVGIAPTATFTILTSNGTGGLTGAFANIGSGQRLATLDGGGSFQVNYGPGSAFAANSIVLSNFVAVPEPSTWTMLGLGGVLLLLRRRRR